MAENMGYTLMDYQERAVSTFHILIDISEDKKTKKQTFNDNFVKEDWENHPPSLNMIYVDMLVPATVDKYSAERIDQITADQEQDNPANKAEPEVDSPENNTVSGTMYDVMFRAFKGL